MISDFGGVEKAENAGYQYRIPCADPDIFLRGGGGGGGGGVPPKTHSSYYMILLISGFQWV